MILHLFKFFYKKHTVNIIQVAYCTVINPKQRLVTKPIKSKYSFKTLLLQVSCSVFKWFLMQKKHKAIEEQVKRNKPEKLSAFKREPRATMPQCNAMQCYEMLWNAMQCYAMQCYAMLCNAMQCYAIHAPPMHTVANKWKSTSTVRLNVFCCHF